MNDTFFLVLKEFVCRGADAIPKRGTKIPLHVILSKETLTKAGWTDTDKLERDGYIRTEHVPPADIPSLLPKLWIGPPDEEESTELLSQDYWSSDEKPKLLARKLARDLVTRSDEHYLSGTSTDTIWYYCEGVYKKGGERKIADTIANILEESCTPQAITKTIIHLRSLSRFDENKFDAQAHLIPFNNVVYDLQSRTARPHSPQHHFTHKTAALYNPLSKCPSFLVFLYEILRPEDIPTVQEIFGYTLLRSHQFQHAFLFLGNGSNGKTTLLAVLTAMLGQDNVVSMPMQELISNRFARINLHKALANIVADAPSTKLNDTHLFKQITGGDPINGEEKGVQGRVRFVNYCKQIYAANDLPINDDWGFAFLRRWVWIKFQKTFTGMNKDPSLVDKLTTTQELTGVLNWALEGLHRLLSNKGFSPNLSSEEVKEEWMRKTDPVKCFCIDRLERGEATDEVTRAEVYEEYQSYCLSTGFDVLRREQFFDLFRTKVDFPLRESRPRHGVQRERVFVGVRFRSELGGLERELDLMWSALVGENGCVDEDSFLAMCENKVKSVEVAEALLAKLKRDGVLFSPQSGKLRKL